MTCRSKANNSMYVLTISVNKHFKDKERLSHLDYQQKWSSERFLMLVHIVAFMSLISHRYDVN